MSRTSRYVLLVLCCAVAAFAVAGCSTTTAEQKSNALTKEEEQFLLATKKVKNKVTSRWNKMVAVARRNGWNVANIGPSEEKQIKQYIKAIDKTLDPALDSPSYRFNKATRLWDDYRDKAYDVTNEMADVLANPTSSNKKQLKRALKKLTKAETAFNREARRLVKASLEQP